MEKNRLKIVQCHTPRGPQSQPSSCPFKFTKVYHLSLSVLTHIYLYADIYIYVHINICLYVCVCVYVIIKNVLEKGRLAGSVS